MANADGGEVDEGLGLSSIFTVRRESFLALYNSAIIPLLDRSYTQDPPRPPSPFTKTSQTWKMIITTTIVIRVQVHGEPSLSGR
jgi:hypothetical protein